MAGRQGVEARDGGVLVGDHEIQILLRAALVVSLQTRDFPDPGKKVLAGAGALRSSLDGRWLGL